MQVEKSRDRIKIIFDQDLNLFTAERMLKACKPFEHVVLDLSGANLVDSEGVIALVRLKESGKSVSVVQPPAIMYEVVSALELEEVLDLDVMVS